LKCLMGHLYERVAATVWLRQLPQATTAATSTAAAVAVTTAVTVPVAAAALAQCDPGAEGRYSGMQQLGLVAKHARE